MGLMNLALELRLTMAEYLDPRSSFSFALTCREHHRLSTRLLATHKQLHKHYCTLNAKDAGRLVWITTKEIIENPNIAHYIEDISLPNTRQVLWHGRRAFFSEINAHSEQVLPDDLVDLYVNACKRDLILKETVENFRHGNEWRYGTNWTFTRSIESGIDSPIIALLLSMACNLRTLRFTEMRFEHGELADFVHRVSLAYRDPACQCLLPFQHLTTVAIAYAGPEGSFLPDWATRFLRIPTIRAFVGYKMGGSHYHKNVDDDFQDHCKSEVKELCFFRSFVQHESIEQIISSTRALEAFTYENGGSCVDELGDFVPRRATEALLQYAAHSLEELVIIDDDGFNLDTDINRISLFEFKELKRLRCPWSLLIGEDDGCEAQSLPDGEFYTEEDGNNHTEFAKILPRSLEVLHLDHGYDQEEQIESIMTLVLEKETDFPNLQQIFLGEGFLDFDGMDEFLEKTQEKGITYSQLQRLSHNPLRSLLKDQGEI